jgi:hypothetical protein
MLHNSSVAIRPKSTLDLVKGTDSDFDDDRRDDVIIQILQVIIPGSEHAGSCGKH